MAKGKSDPAVIEKQKKVLELRRGGLTFDLIAERLGYANASGAHKAYQSACRLWPELPPAVSGCR